MQAAGRALADLLREVQPRDLLLMTDFDGTLAPIVSEREAARALLPTLGALERLVPRLLKVAVISGRGQDDLAARLPVAGLRILGDYGIETLSDAQLRALDAAASGLAPLRGRIPTIQIERKAAAIAVHFRADPAAGAMVVRAASEIAREHGLQATPGKMVIELRLPGADKRNAVARLVESLNPGGALYIGDDENDRPAVDFVNRLAIPNLTIAVASDDAPPDLIGACKEIVDGPEGVSELLTELATRADAV
jgi:trehalose 6-phosphate phosphatase